MSNHLSMPVTPTDDAGSVELFGDIRRETPKAILFNDSVVECWLPKSMITIEAVNQYNQATVMVPEWLAREKDLI